MGGGGCPESRAGIQMRRNSAVRYGKPGCGGRQIVRYPVFFGVHWITSTRMHWLFGSSGGKIPGLNDSRLDGRREGSVTGPVQNPSGRRFGGAGVANAPKPASRRDDCHEGDEPGPHSVSPHGVPGHQKLWSNVVLLLSRAKNPICLLWGTNTDSNHRLGAEQISESGERLSAS